MESRLSGSSLVQMSLEKTHAADPIKLAALKAFEKQSGPVIASSYANLGANAANAGEFANASSYFGRPQSGTRRFLALTRTGAAPPLQLGNM